MRLIDADELLKYIPPEEMCSRFAVENATTVDAVPVIRCKDCKWHLIDTDADEYCAYWGGYVKHDDDFCNWAERKEDGKTD